MSRIFISYKRVDKDKVFKIKDQIESALGEKCWIDLDGIESDAQFMNVIIKAIRECEVLLFMYSKVHAQITDFEKDWTVRELNFAAKKDKRIVFVNIDGSPLSDEFEFMYGTKQQVDATSDNVMSKLCVDLRTWLDIDSRTKKSLNSTTLLQPSQKTQVDKLTFKVGNAEFNMIYVKGGMFTMGATPEMVNSGESEKPAHEVTLSSYFIGETPVTQALWKEVMKNNPSGFKLHSRPVENITWLDCQKFINKINVLTGMRFRLPTEAEWEYAARGGQKTRNTRYSGSNDIEEVAWALCNPACTYSVKVKKANELGIYDMSGNVGEWCEDFFGKYEKMPQVNPNGQLMGCDRVVRGGSWSTLADLCRTSSRSYAHPYTNSNDIGFRLALTV